jgi:hypothetical protein
MTEDRCVCGHQANWHLKHVGGIAHKTIRMSRCLSKVKNERGFPRECGCRAYKAKARAS